jgi:hypothetical protein
MAAGCATPRKAVRLTMCDVLHDPLKYQSREVIVSGWLSLGFESFSFCCRTSDNKDGWYSVWPSFDMDSITRASPKFIADLTEDIKSANAWKGGAKRNVVFRGVLKFSEEHLRTPNEPAAFSGFGHMNLSPGEIRVTEILEYEANQAHD